MILVKGACKNEVMFYKVASPSSSLGLNYSNILLLEALGSIEKEEQLFIGCKSSYKFG